MILENPTKETIVQTPEDFVSDVRLLIQQGLERTLSGLGDCTGGVDLMPGKMLRTRLAGRLLATGSLPVDPAALRCDCAATELVHTASLCHDDVVDNAVIRRKQPALWRAAGTSGAILVGDLLLCEAMTMLVEAGNHKHITEFVAKVREVVEAEAEQELRWRGKRPDAQTCLRLACGKTGPLFAYVGYACGGSDGGIARACEEAGYRIGTAYQLADDLLDLAGSEDAAGKTLGTDAMRDKFTLPQVRDDGGTLTRERISELCASALGCLGSYPAARGALMEFLHLDLQPILNLHLDISMELAV